MLKDDIEKAEAEFIPALLKAGADLADALVEEALINSINPKRRYRRDACMHRIGHSIYILSRMGNNIG